MRTARLITIFVVAGTLGTFFACSDTAKPLGTMDIVIDDTAGQDTGAAQPPPDSGEDSADGYGPAVVACAACSCDPTMNYCFSGGAIATDNGGGVVPDSSDTGDGDTPHLPVVQLAGGFGEPDGAADAGPPPPPCPVLPAGSAQPGCIPLPASCAANPTCACVLGALQPQYTSCYLVCTPTPGFLSVYCGG